MPLQVVYEWLPILLKKHKVTAITVTGHSLGEGLATLSAFDVAELLQAKWPSSQNKEEPGKWNTAGWQTTSPPKVTLIAFAAPRVGNSVFVDRFHKLGIAALRINNKGDFVPMISGVFCRGGMSYVQLRTDGALHVQHNCSVPGVRRDWWRVLAKTKFCAQPDSIICCTEHHICMLPCQTFPPAAGIWVQVLSFFVERFCGKAAVLDMTSSPVRWVRCMYSLAVCLASPCWPSRWGCFHVGQVLELDPAWPGAKLVLDADGLSPASGKRHNLEVCD
jgi:hypothetical protein